MKYIKKYESIFKYDIDIFTIREASEFYYLKFPEYNLKKKLHYFDYNDFSTMNGSDNYEKSCRLIIAHTDNDILGICKFANFDTTGQIGRAHV